MRRIVTLVMKFAALCGRCMTTRRHRLRPLAWVALIALGGAAVTACGGDEPASRPTSPTSNASADEASAAFERYWDVYVQLANSGDINPAAFGGVAEGSFIELDLMGLRDQADSGVVRTGEPDFSGYDTTVDGDKATSLVCVDQSKWGAKVDGEPIPDSTSDTPNPQPYVATLERRHNAWIVIDVNTGAKGVTCPS